MRRKAVAGEFRSNIHRGGTATKVRLTAVYRKTALAAARVLGLRVAGVDMIESDEGPMVMEVNSSPGWKAFRRPPAWTLPTPSSSTSSTKSRSRRRGR